MLHVPTLNSRRLACGELPFLQHPEILVQMVELTVSALALCCTLLSPAVLRTSPLLVQHNSQNLNTILTSPQPLALPSALATNVRVVEPRLQFRSQLLVSLQVVDFLRTHQCLLTNSPLFRAT